MWRYKSRELLHFWVDYAKAQIKTPERLSRKLLLSPNSNFTLLDPYTILELMPDWFHGNYKKFFAIKDIKTNANLCFLAIKWKKIKWINTQYADFIEITGQWLILRSWLKYYIEMLKKLRLEITKYVRVDVCMDINVNTQYFLDTIIKDFHQKKTKTPFYTKWIIHALYIWEKQLKKNTYQFVRIYNKKLDNIIKWKEWLYSEMKNINDVTRLEVEIRRDKAQFLTTEKLLDLNYIFGVCVRTFYQMNNQFFSFLDIEDFKKVEEKEGIRKKRIENQAENKKLIENFWSSFKNPQEKSTTIATFISYAKKLYINWIPKNQLIDIINMNIDENA